MKPTNLASLRMHSRAEASAILRVSEKTLRNWESLGKGPVATRIGGAVRYLESDLADYIVAAREQALQKRGA